MNCEEKLNLQKMIATNDVVDQTELIRQTKHSALIRSQVKELVFLKNNNESLSKSNPEEFEQMCLSKCSFLFYHYTDIYNKVIKDELDLSILDKFLETLHQIEEGKVDQHEASFEIGKLLKKLYIDSALKKTEKNDALNSKDKNKDKNEEIEEPIEISWREYKMKN